MNKIMVAAIAAGGLSLSVADASPLGGSSTVRESGGSAQSQNTGGVLNYLADRLAVSVAAAAGTVGYAADDNNDHRTYENCQGNEPASDEETEEAEATKHKQPVGPEPIYFGF